MQCNRVILRRNFLCPYGVDALRTLGRQRNEGTNCHGWHERKASTVQPLPGNKVPASQGWQSYLASSCTCHATATPSCIYSQPRRMHSTSGWRSGISGTGALNSSLQHIARSLGNTAPVADTDSLSALKRRVSEVSVALSAMLAVADLAGMKAKLAALEHDAANGELWNDASKAQALMGSVSALRSEVGEVEGCMALIEDAQFAVELMEASESISPAEQAAMVQQAMTSVVRLKQALERWELRRLLSGPYDELGARVVISAGAGGVDAMDWAQMMERMYMRWCESRGYSVSVVERMPGEEAGLKSVELEVSGRHAYGYLRNEKGTHRMVRNSPFNAKGLRQTSFAGVDVMPVLAEGSEVVLDIKDGDLEWSTMRAGGKGGQNVNKVETGVRVVYIPTGMSVKCTQERSQVQNKAIALDLLKARLLVILEEQKAAQLAEIRGDLVKAEWGQQIRNYVIHPYRLVKDTRTAHETSDLEAVLDGDLDAFIAAHLRLKGGQAISLSLSEDSPSA